jgi:hypothetical protein
MSDLLKNRSRQSQNLRERNRLILDRRCDDGRAVVVVAPAVAVAAESRYTVLALIADSVAGEESVVDVKDHAVTVVVVVGIVDVEDAPDLRDRHFACGMPRKGFDRAYRVEYREHSIVALLNQKL